MTNKTNGYVIVFEMKEINDGFKSHQCFDRLRGRERERDRYATRNSQNHLFFSSSYFLSAWSDFFSVSLRNRHIRFSLRYGRRQFVWIIKWRAWSSSIVTFFDNYQSQKTVANFWNDEIDCAIFFGWNSSFWMSFCLFSLLNHLIWIWYY